MSKLLTIPEHVFGLIASFIDSEDLLDGLLMTSKVSMSRLRGQIPYKSLDADSYADSLRECILVSLGSLREISFYDAHKCLVAFLRHDWRRVFRGKNLQTVTVDDVEILRGVQFAKRKLPHLVLDMDNTMNHSSKEPMTPEAYSSLVEAKVQAVTILLHQYDEDLSDEPWIPSGKTLQAMFPDATGLEITYPMNDLLTAMKPKSLKKLKYLAVGPYDMSTVSDFLSEAVEHKPLVHLEDLEAMRCPFYFFDNLPGLGKMTLWSKLKTLILVGNTAASDDSFWSNLHRSAPNLKNIEVHAGDLWAAATDGRVSSSSFLNK